VPLVGEARTRLPVHLRSGGHLDFLGIVQVGVHIGADPRRVQQGQSPDAGLEVASHAAPHLGPLADDEEITGDRSVDDGTTGQRQGISSDSCVPGEREVLGGCIRIAAHPTSQPRAFAERMEGARHDAIQLQAPRYREQIAAHLSAQGEPLREDDQVARYDAIHTNRLGRDHQGPIHDLVPGDVNRLSMANVECGGVLGC
jgi:hypothetical protein